MAATAAAAIRHLHHRPSLPSTTQKTATHCTLRLPLFQLCLLKSQLFVIRTPLEALIQSQSRHPFYRRRLCAASVYNEFDDGFDEDDAELGDEKPPLPPSRSSAPDDSRRLYVGNLPFTMTPSDLSELFSQAGNIDAVELVYDRVTDRSRGFAFITMGSVEEANEAIRMFDGSQVGGRTVKVNFPEVPRGGEREAMGPKPRRGSRTFVSSPYKVYAGNLGWALTSQSLRDAFAGQRGLLGARVVYDRDSGLSRGFGFLSFESPEDAESAIEAMNGQELEGRPLRLSLAVGKPSTSLSQASLADQSTERISVVEPY